MSNMKSKDFRDGMRVTCNIFGKKIDDAKLSLGENGWWYVCQNKMNGYTAPDTKGYKFSWFIDPLSSAISITNLKPLRPAKQSHHRKPSPESGLVGSCTLLKKWKWRTQDWYGLEQVWTHKPRHYSRDGLWDCEKGTVRNCGGIFEPINHKRRLTFQRLYRRQGDKWVHVG